MKTKTPITLKDINSLRLHVRVKFVLLLNSTKRMQHLLVKRVEKP